MPSQLSFSFFEPTNRHSPLKQKSDVRTGFAGESLVVSVLSKFGFEVYNCPQNSAFDLLVFQEQQPIRIQVKTRTSDKALIPYNFTRGCYSSKTGVYRYAKNSFDAAALVSLSLMKVLFITGVPSSTVTVRRTEFLKPNSDRATWNLVLASQKSYKK